MGIYDEDDPYSMYSMPAIIVINPAEGILQMAGDNEAIKTLLQDPGTVCKQRMLLQVVVQISTDRLCPSWELVVLNMVGETMCQFSAPVADATLGDLRTAVPEQAGLLQESFNLLACDLSLDGEDSELLSTAFSKIPPGCLKSDVVNTSEP